MSRYHLSLIFTLIIGFIVCAHAREFLYPIACAKTNGIYFIHQKSTQELALLLWNTKTKTAFAQLPSSFIPAGFAMLPNKNGFSFIDNGRIRIKMFAKRCARSLAMSEPLYQFGCLEWIDNNSFYVSAKKRDRYGIFQITNRGDVATIVLYDGFDCLYPQKVDDKLFYIERSDDGIQCSIVCAPYPSVHFDQDNNFNNVENLQERMAALFRDEHASTHELIQRSAVQFLYKNSNKSLVFLNMVSGTEGFFIEHASTIDKDADVMSFSYHRIKKEEDVWKHSFLFSFSIPMTLLVSSHDDRLYESLLPLLPRHYGDEIYYSDCLTTSDNNDLNIFCYSLLAGVTTQKTFGKKDQHFFASLKVGEHIVYGGTLADRDGNQPIVLTKSVYENYL